MAPTEVLADQHYLELSRRLSALGVDVRLLKGSQSAGEKRACAGGGRVRSRQILSWALTP